MRDADYTLTYTAGTGGAISGLASQTVKQGLSGAAVTAVANTGHHFVQWSDAVTSNPRTDANVIASLNMSASFAVTTYSLNITAANGTVGKSPSQTAYDDGTTVALTATPATGYRFTDWTGDVAAGHENDNPLNLMMNGNKSLTASFVINQYTLAYTAGAGGSISGTTPQTVNYGASGAAVTAVPATGYHFVQWSDGVTANPRTDTNVTANLNVSASFGAGQFLWTWMKGASTGGQSGTYGTLGTADAANTPGARRTAISWIDKAGALWLFGGNGKDGAGQTGYLNDLWKYEPATGNWTWMKGASTVDQGGTYGTLGTAAAANTPGSRFSAAAWTDGAGALWLLGGNGKEGAGQWTGVLNDLWKYTPATGQWTWVKGATTIEQDGTYGTLETADETNTLGARQYAAAWTDGTGRLWLFGGYGRDSFSRNNGPLNDLWRGIMVYSLSYAAGSGGSLSGPATQTVEPGQSGATVTAVPEAGFHFVQWSDGVTYSSRTDANVTDNINVTASFAINQYTLAYTAGTGGSLSGATSQTVNYGQNGSAVTAVPDANYHFTQWSDWSSDNPRTDDYVTGNVNVTAIFGTERFSWTWMEGSSRIDEFGTYSTLGIPDVDNVPGARYDAVSWTDGAGNLWLWGGQGNDGAGQTGFLNDLWKYAPATGNWTWMKGASTVMQSGTYGTQGTAAAANNPGARDNAVTWTDGAGNLWLWGGYGRDGTGQVGHLNDMWKYAPATGNWTWMKGAATVD